MSPHTCPPWIGYLLLLNPLRRLFQNPQKLLGPLVRRGMTVLEPGPGMGYFTLPMARMVGPRGKVVALDVQQKMLDVLEKRARRAGLADRIDLRLVQKSDMGLADLAGRVDFVAAIHVVHEVPDPAAFFRSVFQSLKPGGRLLIVEPKGHVSQEEFARTVSTAEKSGFAREDPPCKIRGRAALFSKGTAASP